MLRGMGSFVFFRMPVTISRVDKYLRPDGAIMMMMLWLLRTKKEPVKVKFPPEKKSELWSKGERKSSDPRDTLSLPSSIHFALGGTTWLQRIPAKGRLSPERNPRFTCISYHEESERKSLTQRFIITNRCAATRDTYSHVGAVPLT